VKSLVLVNCTPEFKHHRTLLRAEVSAKSSLKPGYAAAMIWKPVVPDCTVRDTRMIRSAYHADARHVELPQALIDEPFAAKIEVSRSIMPSA
jgi:hypothetical protein